MVLSRDEGTSARHAGTTPTSVPDIARALRGAREQAGLTVTGAAGRAGLTSDDVEALESGTVGRMNDRVETLRSLQRYADSLGLPGGDFVLRTIDLWPATAGFGVRSGDTGALPVVSVSSAPAGGHSPAGVWPGDRTGVTDFTITGMVGPAAPAPVNDTGQVPVHDTGEIPAVGTSAPRVLKVLVAVVALLVVLGGVGLAEHAHVSGWADSARSSVSRWYTDATRAIGLTHKPAVKPKVAAGAGAKVPVPKVDIMQNPGTNGVTFNVHASSFEVKVAAYGHPCWVQVTDVSHFAPVYSGVLPGGETHVFTVSQSTTVETASGSGRVFVYWHNRFIGFYFPTRVPYTMTFNAVA